ncbi:unnamed protein product [Rhizophagus irregularis]|nr:unnamed protein product [Rhizophagus irregularis]
MFEQRNLFLRNCSHPTKKILRILPNRWDIWVTLRGVLGTYNRKSWNQLRNNVFIYNEAKLSRYVKVLEDHRFPYLNLSALAHGIPSFFFDETVRVAAGTEKDKSKRYSEFQIRNPTQRPYVPKVGAPYTPEGFATNRHLMRTTLAKLMKQAA